MNITLPDGRKATVVNQVSDKTVIIRFEDGRETMWPIDKLPKEKEGEDTLKLVKVSYIDQLSDMIRDKEVIINAEKYLRGVSIPLDTTAEDNLLKSLYIKANVEFRDKWGLT